MDIISQLPLVNCVVKKFKDSYTWESSGWDNTILMQQRAQEMARNFGYGLEYTNCDNLKVLGIILPVEGRGVYRGIHRGVRVQLYM